MAQGETGEICARGPKAIMLSYWREPELTCAGVA